MCVDNCNIEYDDDFHDKEDEVGEDYIEEVNKKYKNCLEECEFAKIGRTDFWDYYMYYTLSRWFYVKVYVFLFLFSKCLKIIIFVFLKKTQNC